MFGVGLLELTVIALVAVVVLGPERLPEIARQAAHFIQKARTLANSARDELRTELGPEYSDLQLRDLDPRNIVRKHITEALSDNPLEALTPSQASDVKSSSLPSGGVPPYDVEAT